MNGDEKILIEDIFIEETKKKNRNAKPLIYFKNCYFQITLLMFTLV